MGDTLTSRRLRRPRALACAALLCALTCLAATAGADALPRVGLRFTGQVGLGESVLTSGSYFSALFGMRLEGEVWLTRHLGAGAFYGGLSVLPLATPSGVGVATGVEDDTLQARFLVRTDPLRFAWRRCALFSVAGVGLGAGRVRLRDREQHVLASDTYVAGSLDAALVLDVYWLAALAGLRLDVDGHGDWGATLLLGAGVSF